MNKCSEIIENKSVLVIGFISAALLLTTILLAGTGTAQSQTPKRSNMEKPDGHEATTMSCDSCHVDPANGNFRFVHKRASLDICILCHNDIIATGKPASHLPTSANCGSCHKDPGGDWASVATDHRSVSGTYFSCHNGTTAPGKPANFIATGNSCELCYTTRAWQPAVGTRRGNRSLHPVP